MRAVAASLYQTVTSQSPASDRPGAASATRVVRPHPNGGAQPGCTKSRELCGQIVHSCTIGFVVTTFTGGGWKLPGCSCPPPGPAASRANPALLGRGEAAAP